MIRLFRPQWENVGLVLLKSTKEDFIFKEKILEYFRLLKVINIFNLSDLTDRLAEENCYNKQILNIYVSILLISLLPDLYDMYLTQNPSFKILIPILCLWTVIKTDSKLSYYLDIDRYRVICLYTAIRIKALIIGSVIPVIALKFSGAGENFDASKLDIIALSCFAVLFFGYLLIYGANMQIKLRCNNLLTITWGRFILSIFCGLVCIFYMLVFSFLIISEISHNLWADNIIYSFLILLFAELCAYYFRKRRKLVP
jgi:hypothetical protein